MIFPSRFEPAGVFQATQRWIDRAARQPGDCDDVKTMLVTVGDGLEHGGGGMRQRLHMTYSTYVANHVKLNRLRRGRDWQKVRGGCCGGSRSCLTAAMAPLARSLRGAHSDSIL